MAEDFSGGKKHNFIGKEHARPFRAGVTVVDVQKQSTQVSTEIPV